MSKDEGEVSDRVQRKGEKEGFLEQRGAEAKSAACVAYLAPRESV